MSASPYRRRCALIGLALAAALACAGEAPEPPPPEASETPTARSPAAEPFALSTAEEIRAELEVLAYEITDLERYVIANPSAFVADSPPPRAMLSRARAAHSAAQAELARADTSAAVDSVTAAASHIERVKRILGVAEEWGVD